MYWRLQTRYFAQLGEYTVCVFDNCGSGRSTIAPGPYKISQLARDACQIMDHLGWTQDIHIVGISLGGMIAQEICLLNTDPQKFASVALVDTWHSSTLAVPTVKEVRFAFNGMAALGDNPKHLIKLVFSREWINSPFHDTVREAELCATETMANPTAESPPNDAVATNKDVVMGLFRAIQLDLYSQRMPAETLESTPETSPGISPQPKGCSPEINRMASVSHLNPIGPRNKHTTRPYAVSHAKTDPNTICRSNESGNLPWLQRPPTDTGAKIPPLPATQSRKSKQQQQNINTDSATLLSSKAASVKREVSGDIHQFMACLGHRFSSQQVKSMQKQNPHTRFLVIHGEKDRVIRPVCGRTLAKLLGCPVVWIRGAGHMPLIDAHCTFNLIIRAFTRDERWLRELADRTCLSPASWDEQVKVRRWMGHSRPIPEGNREISLDIGDASHPRLRSDSPPPSIFSTSSTAEPVANKQRTSRIDCIRPVGPLKKSSSHSSASSVSSSKSDHLRTREMIIYGALLDAPLRIRRYSTAALNT
ncbi:alpha/beta-hydrolase [Coemansia reversa NRRL 1564]|uniref:Alpha/beta-hydrolase n=1 Tax=Coemansia reversa (strain ATCC 12441 / NRRL 1564) TaxID=763665 RepID=A0A2G5B580_COERN|nr:alpha/beta-hydrolase [Coemansia reversa NRRL 1564]|eukprot:PIA14150.1 alpha/beta-hydrolase [Coemansia reversa NRRL 1564]